MIKEIICTAIIATVYTVIFAALAWVLGIGPNSRMELFIITLIGVEVARRNLSFWGYFYD